MTGKIAISKNNLIYSKSNKKITNVHSDKFTHLLRYKNDALMVSYKTLNKDNSKLNCRIKGFSNYSPKRIILDNKLLTKVNSYVVKTANKNRKELTIKNNNPITLVKSINLSLEIEVLEASLNTERILLKFGINKLIICFT